MQTRLLLTCALLFFLPMASPLSAQDPNAPRLVPVAEAPAAFAAPVPDEAVPPMARPRIKPDGRITLELHDGSRLVGKPVDLESLTFNGSFGEIKIPLKSVKGIRFAAGKEDPDNHAKTDVLLFRNRDLLTGHLELKTIELETVWGEAVVSIKHIASIVNSPNLHLWIYNDRWRLIPHFGTSNTATPYDTAPRPPPPRDRYPTPPTYYPPSAVPSPFPPSAPSRAPAPGRSSVPGSETYE